MSPDSKRRVNAEEINDRVKLLLHRVVARRLMQDPTLLDKAAEILKSRRLQHGDRLYIGEWESLLDKGAEEVRREIVKRDERMTRLRISSPFATVVNFQDPALRRRVWRNARKYLASHA